MTITTEKASRIIKSMQIIAVLAECISIEFQSDLVDTKFKNPAVNNHSKRIRESAEAIKLHLSSVVKNKDRDFFGYEYAAEMHRLVTHFSGMDIKQIADFMDGIEELKNVELKKAG